MSLISSFLNAASRNDAGITFVHAGGSEETISYGDIYIGALHALGALQRAGVQQGSEVIIQTENNKYFLYLFWACILGGIVPVPLSIGAQEAQKNKIFGIWKCLRNPFLVTDNEQARRLKELEVPSGLLKDFDQCFISIHEVISSNIAGVLASIEDTDIAYIQFSSGSTGTPKGVSLTHRNLLINVGDIISSLEITDRDTLLSWMPLTHDMGIIGFHLTGIVKNIPAISIPTAVFIRRPLMWLDKVSEYRASVLYSPNFGLHYFLSAMEPDVRYKWDLSCIRIIINGAETISAQLCQKFITNLATYGIDEKCMVAAYGLAEAAVEVSAMPVSSPLLYHHLDRAYLNIGDSIRVMEDGLECGVCFVDVGFPVASCRVRICDAVDMELPENVIGHIQIKGGNVTMGYYNNPAETANVFTSDSWLRTGDVGFLRNGRLTVTGRIKNIIIINGQNYYPHDIEHLITDAGIVPFGKVVACGFRPPGDAEEKLIIFVLYKKSFESFRDVQLEIRSVLAAGIGVYAHDIVPVKKIPKTTSGKIQYFSLLAQYEKELLSVTAQEIHHGEIPVAHTPDSLARALAEIVSDSLGYSVIEDGRSLYDCGMNSLMAMQLSGRIFQLTGVQVPAEVIFGRSTILEISHYICERWHSDNLPEVLWQKETPGFELSLAQQRIWTECQLKGYTTAYNVPVLYKINGELNVNRLEEAFRTLISRHEILRTSFEIKDNRPMQVVHPYDDLLFSVETEDLRTIPDKVMLADSICRETANTIFSFTTPSQFRLKIIRLENEAYLLLFVIHHIVVDGWSLSKIFEESARYYNYTSTDHSLEFNETLQYRNYVSWQQRLLLSDLMNKQRKYWIEELHNAPDPPGLTSSVKIGNAVTGFAVQTCESIFSRTDTNLLKQIALRFETTPFGILMTLLNVILYRYNNVRDIVTGFDVTGRVLKEIEQVAGYTLNTLCLRAELNGTMIFSDLVPIIKHKLFLALDNQLYPFEKLIEERLSDARIAGRPLFSILVLYQNFIEKGTDFSLRGCSIERKSIDVSQGFTDLVIEFTEDDHELKMRLQYNSNIYTTAEMSRFSLHLFNLLRAVGLDDSKEIREYNFFTEEEKLLWTPLKYEPIENRQTKLPVHLAFERKAVISPNSIAIHAGESILTYRQLNERVNIIANFIRRKLEVSPDDRVGFFVSRNENIIIAILAILKSGAAYVAVDGEMPVEMRRHIVEDSGMKCLLTDSKTIAKIDEKYATGFLINVDDIVYEQDDTNNPVYSGKSADLAYVIYTSGSTGTPKGVMIEHKTLTSYVREFIRYFDITAKDIFVQQASVAFDTIIEEIFPALCTAGKIVIASSGGKDIEALLLLISRYKVTVLSTTPLVLNEVNNNADSRIATIRLIISGGDVLHASNVGKLFCNVRVYNSYGPSETTVCATYHEVTVLDEASLIGKPVPGYQVYILDEYLQPMPWGKVGEIYIEGGLARGYLNLPVLTAERFIESPFDETKKLYKSGDLACFTENGQIAFEGRRDHQVKIRGHRVEPAEVEKVISAFPTIKLTTVVWNRHADYLVAYLTVRTNFSEQELRLFISEYLPSYMVPYRFEVIENMPLTSSGKVDRMALSRRTIHTPVSTDEIPVDFLEKKLIQLVKQVLNLDSIGMTDNLFESGCNSIKATSIAGLIHQELKYKIEIRDLFIFPTVKLLSRRIRNLFQTRFESIPRVNVFPYYELSSAQKGLWILSRMEEQSFAYNESLLYEVSGSIDPAAVKKAFEVIVARHEILRTTFDLVDDEPVQIVHDISAGEVNFKYEDWTCCDDIGSVPELITAFAEAPFDLQEGPLYRIMLVNTAADRYLLLVVMHHIITDDWSSELLLQEFSIVYNACRKGEDTFSLPEARQYKDYVFWANRNALEEDMSRHRRYWYSQFKGHIPLLDLPLDFKRPAIKRHQGGFVHTVISPRCYSDLNELCRDSNLSMFMVLLSALYVLLSRYTGQYDMVIGTPLAGRGHPDLDGMLGFFINSVPLRIRADKECSLDELMRKVKAVCLDAYEHQGWTFENIVNDLQFNRDLSRSPVFDVLINYSVKESRQRILSLDGASLSKTNKRAAGSKFDLTIYVEDDKEGLSCRFEFDTHLFMESTVERMMAHYINILESFPMKSAAAISRIDFAAKQEKEQLLYLFNRPMEIASGETVIDLFSRCSAMYGHKTALVSGGVEFSFEYIDKRSDALAYYLRHTCYVKHNDRIGLLMGRSEHLICAILAVWKVGATYIPIDPEYPGERIRYILKDTGAVVLLSDADNLSIIRQADLDQFCMTFCADTTLDMCTGGKDRVPPAKMADLAYIMYTSGSTGNPKGVEVYHSSVVNVLLSLQKEPGISDTDTCLAVSNYTFDISVSEFILPLISGAKLVLAAKKETIDINALIELLNIYRPTYMQGTPSLWNALIEEGWKGNPDMKAVSCGEPLMPTLLDMMLERTAALWNFYGPTETTIFSTGQQMCSGKSVTIGAPIRNTNVYILDSSLELLPIGVFGELYIGGNGVARGYLNHPEMTLERFVAWSSERDERIYATGDIGRWLMDGSIELRGRNDNQVKIRGMRVELGEIEQAIMKHPGILSAAAIVPADEVNQERIVAYIQWRKGVREEEAIVKAHLRKYLPIYMIPVYLIDIGEMPMTNNGKINRVELSLRPIPMRRQTAANTSRSLATGIEQVLLGIWEDVLSRNDISVSDDFFDVGGHSLMANKLVNKIQLVLGVKIALTDVFQHSTVKALGELISGLEGDAYSYIDV